MDADRSRSSFGLSLALHAILLLFWAFYASHLAQLPHPSKTIWIEVEERTPDTTINKQIVQTSPGTKVDKAVDKSFLGEKNQVVDRQTVSKERTTVMEQQSRATEAAREKQQPVDQLSRLGVPLLPRVIPRPEQLTDEHEWAEQGKLAQDYIKNITEGERTALNTKEFVFYSYYQRIRERLDRAWVPLLRKKLYKIYESGRQLASDMEHMTRVLVVLNDKGEVIKVKILNESGTQDLDDAAVHAFGEAGPFPNPPHGIIDAKGEIEIPWEFILRT